MDQVSRPLLIALASVVALAAVWMVALRPKDEESAAPAPSVATPVDAVPKAQAAVAATDAATQASDAASTAAGGDTAAPPATGSEPATAAPQAAAPKAAPGKSTPPATQAASPAEARVLKAMDAGKVVTMLFQNPKAADDRAVTRAVRSVSRRGGKVSVFVIPIRKVGEYESITRGVTVTQSPTVVVIDRERKARSIVGLTGRTELDQAIGDALKAR